MTATPVVVGEGQLSASTAIMMSPVTEQTLLSSVVFSNSNTAVETVSVYLVREGGAPGPGNNIIPGQQLAPNQTYVSPELRGQVLNLGDALYGLSTDGSVTYYVINGTTFG